MTPAASGGPGGPRLSAVDLGLLGALGLLWGSAYIFIRQGLLFGASPLVFAAARYAISAAVFGAVAIARRERFPARHNLGVSAAIGGILVIGLYGGFLYSGEQFITGGYGAALSSTIPILTVVVSYALLPAERLGRLALAGVLVGFGGVLVLVLPELQGGGMGTFRGAVLAVAAFLSTVVGSVLLRRFGGGRQGLWQIGSQFAVGSLLLGAGMMVVPTPEVLPTTVAVWSALLVLVVFSSVLGYFTYFVLHHRVGPSRANLVAYLLPLVGVGIGSGLYGEPATIWEIAGFLIVLGGVALTARGAGRPA